MCPCSCGDRSGLRALRAHFCDLPCGCRRGNRAGGAVGNRPASELSPVVARRAALRAENVTKHYGHILALDHVSLDLIAGECIALIGESGSGKTTLLRCFNRLVDPEEGHILVD